MVDSRDNISLLILRTPNQELVVVRIKPCPYLVNELAKTGSTHGLADVQERCFPDFPTNTNFKRHQAQSILRGEGRDNEVERALDNAVLKIRSAGGDVWWGDGDDEDEVQGRVSEGGKGIGGITRETWGDQRYGNRGVVS